MQKALKTDSVRVRVRTNEKGSRSFPFHETDDAAPDAFLTVDGQEGIPLCGGDVIRVQSLDAGLRVLSCSSGTYFQRLRERGFIQTDGTSAPEHV